MKRLSYLFIVLLVCLFTCSVQAQTDIFMSITDANNVTLTAGLGAGPYANYAEVISLQYDQELPITIGSQGGSATGKIVFDPLTITKAVNALSTKLMLAQAKGTLLKTIEFVFVYRGASSSSVSHKIVLKQAAVKSYSSSFSTDQETPSESISFDYGVVQVFTYTQDPTTLQYVENPVHYGWDRLSNIPAQ